MEGDQYFRNNCFKSGHQRNPYDRGPNQRTRRDYARQRGRSERGHNFPQNYYNRPYYQQYQSTERTFDRRGRSTFSDESPQFSCVDDRPYFQRYQPPERTFDARGRSTFSNERPHFNHRDDNHDNEDNAGLFPSPNPVEEKARNLLNTVLTQDGPHLKLIFLETTENALQTLQTTVDYHKLKMTIEQSDAGKFALKIGEVEVVSGEYETKQLAKNALASEAVEKLKKHCFYILKKKTYEEVSVKEKEVKDDAKASSSFAGSKAHQMMLKMGWGGKGLGASEQGAEKTVAETLNQNVSRQGLGTSDVFTKIHKLLEEYAQSDKISLLMFDPDFTSEERAHIHKIALKLGLKSKSEGKGEQRRITVTKKLHRADLVYNLLTCSLENSLYKLEIPDNFIYLWN